MVLDSDHRVPWKINTFLRDYQREGIRFFFKRYQEGRGGLLGDDMGLVRASGFTSLHSIDYSAHLGYATYTKEA